jgi:hypothetical protein
VLAGALHHIRVGPVLWIEERIAPDRDPRTGFGDLAELHSDVAFTRIRAHRLREHANADFELRRHLIDIACMIEGMPTITITLLMQKPGAPDTLLRMRSAPLGMRVKRRRASFISAPVVFTHSCRMASAGGSLSIGTPNAFATQSAVMSPWVGPIGVVVPERIDCVDDRSLLIADHPHFLEIDAERRQIFRDVADVLVLGAAR